MPQAAGRGAPTPEGLEGGGSLCEAEQTIRWLRQVAQEAAAAGLAGQRLGAVHSCRRPQQLQVLLQLRADGDAGGVGLQGGRAA